MKKTNVNRIKFFIVVTLSLLLVGLVLIGVFGLNTTVDYPNTAVNGYEVQVSVDQKAGNSYDILKSSTEEFFTANGLAPSGIVQKISDGKALIYKFSNDVTEKVNGLAEFVDGKLEAAGLTTVAVEVEVNQLSNYVFDGIWWLVFACGIAIVAIFIYTLIMEKLAGSLATVFASVLAAILFVALLGITRIPASPFVGIGAAAAAAIAGAASVATVNRYKEEAKNNASLSALEVVEKVAPSERKKYIILGAAIAVTAIALVAFGMPYLMIAGVQLLLAGVAGTFSAYLGSAFMWTAIKNAKRK